MAAAVSGRFRVDVPAGFRRDTRGDIPGRQIRVRSGPLMNNIFARFARCIALWMAHPLAFALALLAVVVWALAGPVFGYSESWQLVVNTGTTIMTFLMVFLLQNIQNRDSRAVQLKLDELIRALTGARNELIDVENFTEEELERYCAEFSKIHRHYENALRKRKGKSVPPAAEAPAKASSEG